MINFNVKLYYFTNAANKVLPILFPEMNYSLILVNNFMLKNGITFLLWLAFLLPLSSFGTGFTADSLMRIFKDRSLHDTSRARAITLFINQNTDFQFPDRIAMLDTAEAMAEKYNDEGLAAFILKSLTDAFNAEGGSYTIACFRAATRYLFYSVEHKDTLNEARAYTYRGDCYANLDMLDEAIKEQLNAITLFKRTSAKHELDYGNYLAGYYLFNDRHYRRALTHFTAAYKGYLEEKTGYEDLVEDAGWLGNTYNALKKFDSALYYRNLALSMSLAHKNLPLVADCYRYLGNLYQNMKLPDSALTAYSKSMELFKKTNETGRYWLVKYFIAGIYYIKKDYRSSAAILDEILDTTHGSRDILAIYLSSQLGGKVYYADGQKDKSVSAYRRFIKLSDSIQNAKDSSSINEVNTKLQLGEQELQIRMEQAQQVMAIKKDRQREAIIRDALIAGIVLALIFTGMLYRLFMQTKKANENLAVQNDKITAQKKEIEDSINYARNIQEAILPEVGDLQKYIPQLFVLYKPKDVVSGDFYWFTEQKGNLYIAAADCTGHGVPGAFMSLIGMDMLTNIIQVEGITQPGKILSTLNAKVKEVFRQKNIGKGTLVRDGMDISLVCMPALNDRNELKFSGSNRPLFIYTNHKIEELKPTKAAIGGHTEDDKTFDEQLVKLNKGDMLYLTSDGFADQFGGPQGKKFTKQRFKELLATAALEPICKQKELLEKALSAWQGSLEQLDDILVVGLQI